MQTYLYLSIAGENRIAIYTFDVSDGTIEFQEDVNVSGSPGPLTLSRCGNYLYAGLRSSREIASFSIDKKSKQLTLLRTINLDADTCYIATDKTGNYLLSAYYGAGKVTVHAIGEDKTVQGEPIQTIETAPHAHYIETDATNRFAFVPHTVPRNAIYQFHFDAETGLLTKNFFGHLNPDDPVGPRHYCEHPNKPIFYFSNENGSSVSAYNLQKGDPDASIPKSGVPDYTVNDAPGLLWEFQTLSTLPSDFDENNTCAQIHIDPQGKFLYVSNRGDDSIAMFSIDEENGELTALGHQPTEPTPRVFNIDETGNYLFVGGQGSGKLATYRINSNSGILSAMDSLEVGKNPMWVMFL